MKDFKTWKKINKYQSFMQGHFQWKSENSNLEKKTKKNKLISTWYNLKDIIVLNVIFYLCSLLA